MKQKKWLWKLTGYILLALVVCTGLARQFQRLLMPQVTAAPLEAGTITHEDAYPAVFGKAGSDMVSWQVDGQGYEYYGDNQKASLEWLDQDGERQREVFKIAGKEQNADGTWNFTMDIAKLSGKLQEDTDAAVWMELESEYDYTLPLSALSMDADGYLVFIIETHQGIFSDEQIVQGRPVDVVDTDGVMAAVTPGWADQVVTCTSKPLWSGMQVAVE